MLPKSEIILTKSFNQFQLLLSIDGMMRSTAIQYLTRCTYFVRSSYHGHTVTGLVFQVLWSFNNLFPCVSTNILHCILSFLKCVT
jgi:hypothetical protein